ncbi:iron-containing alcohol dehydrogenase [Succinivibrio dextrinosolvens]|uniref:iron-containing alcohol dehydrogenase n=1 Tax=Succinivibrio dextrinosolvens TaxID=83771 RepID=UPI0004E1B254|nr:iron-containing alcohol dehydrogenase [Succinivibrio dextrinosolvens]
MYNFELNNDTKIIFGKEGRKKIGKVLYPFGSRVLLVYGGNSIKEIGLFKELVDTLIQNKISIVEFSGIKSNPTCSMVNKGAELCREKSVDVILAVGGGSVIDTAKAISVANYYEGPFEDILEKKTIISDAIPLIAISTISGSGSEMNCSCVITNERLKKKCGFNSDLIRPKYAFLDPELTYSVNSYQTACGSADILSHILDTTYMVNGSKLQMLKGVMESVSRTIIKYTPIAMNDPTNYEARANLMLASTWGLNGFLKNGIKQLAACHAIEHELSAQFNIIHGAGMAIVMPAYYEYVLSEENECIYAEFCKNVFGDNSPNVSDAARIMIDKLKYFFFEELKLPSKLSDLGVTSFDTASAAYNICWGKDLPGLVNLSIKDVDNILKNIM